MSAQGRPFTGVRRTLASLALLGTASAAGGSALAIEPLRVEPDLSTYHKAGSFYWQPTLSLRDVGYDDNLFLNSDESPFETDFTYTILPAAQFYATAGDHAAFRGQGTFSYTTYNRHSDQNYFAGGGSARGDYYFTNWNLYAEADYTTTRVRPTDEFHVRPRRIDHGVTLGARLMRAERVSLNLYASQDDATFRELDLAGATDFRSRLNRSEHAAGAAFAYRVGRKTDLTVEAEERDYFFDDTQALTDRADSNRVMAGLDWRPTSRVLARLRAGHMRFEPRDLSGQSFDGPAWSASISVRIFPRLWGNLSTGRDLWLSAFENNLFAVSDRVALNFASPLTSKAGVEFGGEYAVAKYSDATATPVARIDHATRVFAGGRYRFSKQTSVSLRLTHFLRNANIDGQDAPENLVSGALDWIF